MAHIQLKNGVRLFVKGESGPEKIVVQRGKSVELMCNTAAEGGGPLRLSASGGTVNIKNYTAVSRFLQSFTLEAASDGTASLIGVKDGFNVLDTLKVVVGDFRNHTDMSTDLLASEIGRSDDAQKIHALQRMLNNDENNIFNQLSDANKKRFKSGLACGSVCKAGAQAVFGRESVSEKYITYHEKLRTLRSRDDIRYREGTISRARKNIERLLGNGTAVRVGVTYHPTESMLKGGMLQPTASGGHFVLIVGCNNKADTFLYIDPWPGGSTLTYAGGVSADPYTQKCNHLGFFVLEKTPRGPILRQHASAEGTFEGDTFMEVIAGP